jgi:hypothetical protein
VTSLSDTPRLQYYDVQTLEYRYISKLPMKNDWIWNFTEPLVYFIISFIISAVRFDITLKQNDDTKRLNLKSTYRLHVSNVCLMLEDLEKQEPKYKWYYDQLRRYGKTGLEYRYISKLPMKNDWIWNFVILK